MKVLFAGSPDIAVPSLDKVNEICEIAGVLTAPDTRKGRGRALVFNPVKERALELGLSVLQPEKLRREAREEIAPLGAELLVVFAYGKIFGPKFLSLFPRGGLNVHPSLLPHYRGSAPITASILNGDEETGVSVQTVELEVDSGNILGRRPVRLDRSETSATLALRMAREGAEALEEVLSAMISQRLNGEEQNEREVSICRRMTKRDGLINWTLPAEMIERMVRAYIPWPKAFTYWGKKRLTILESRLPESSVYEDSAHDSAMEQSSAAGVPKQSGRVLGMDREEGILVQTGRGPLAITKLQLEGKKPLAWEQFLNGNRDFLEAELGESR